MPFVKVRKFNQVTIPKKIGAEVGIGEGDYIEVEKTPEGNILLKPLKVKAVFIDKDKDMSRLTQEKVLELVRQGELTTSHAAELLGIEYQDFLDLMFKAGVPLLNYTKEIMEESNKNLEKHFSKEKEKA